MKVKSILFVCLGNICRSPLAEGIAREMCKNNGWNLKIDSAGTSAYHRGEPPDRRSIEVARTHNIDISHLKSRPLNVYDDMNFELIIAMDSNNKRDILALGFPDHKVFKLGDFALDSIESNLGDSKNMASIDVPDPYYQGKEGFIATYNLIESLLQKMFMKLK